MMNTLNFFDVAQHHQRDPRMSLCHGSFLLSPIADELKSHRTETYVTFYNHRTSQEIPQQNNDCTSQPVKNTNKFSPSKSIRKSPIRKTTPSDLCKSRKDYIRRSTIPSPEAGYIRCKLCGQEIWGPNGRYHIDKCIVLSSKRKEARNHGKALSHVLGFSVDERILKPIEPTPKRAKLNGFVKSSSVSLVDPTYCPSPEEMQSGVQVGRSGYVRCLLCNLEVFAPNSKHHAELCHKREL